MTTQDHELEAEDFHEDHIPVMSGDSQDLAFRRGEMVELRFLLWSYEGMVVDPQSLNG